MKDWRRIVVLTGAGVSAESGVPTFRDSGGLWEGERIEDVASPEGFERDPARVHRFYNARRARLPAVSPNAAHRALVDLERGWGVGRPGAEFLLVTQNVDDLHERAGSQNLLHMHGELLKARCTACGAVHAWSGDLDAAIACPTCGASAAEGRGGRLARESAGMRPHIVWFGETPLELPRTLEALRACDVFVAIGTSGLVYPAAGFVRVAGAAGARTVELNLEATGGGFDESIQGLATRVTPAFVERLLQ
jgi:NAD-dependent deacetylase